MVLGEVYVIIIYDFALSLYALGFAFVACVFVGAMFKTILQISKYNKDAADAT
jgi:hypothetical protein